MPIKQVAELPVFPENPLGLVRGSAIEAKLPAVRELGLEVGDQIPVGFDGEYVRCGGFTWRIGRIVEEIQRGIWEVIGVIDLSDPRLSVAFAREIEWLEFTQIAGGEEQMPDVLFEDAVLRIAREVMDEVGSHANQGHDGGRSGDRCAACEARYMSAFVGIQNLADDSSSAAHEIVEAVSREVRSCRDFHPSPAQTPLPIGVAPGLTWHPAPLAFTCRCPTKVWLCFCKLSDLAKLAGA